MYAKNCSDLLRRFPGSEWFAELSNRSMQSTGVSAGVNFGRFNLKISGRKKAGAVGREPVFPFDSVSLYN